MKNKRKLKFESLCSHVWLPLLVGASKTAAVKINKNKRSLCLYWLLLGSFFSLQAIKSDDLLYPQDGQTLMQATLLEVQTFNNQENYGNYENSFQGFNQGTFLGNSPDVQLRLDGIGGDDDALGEEPIPVNDGLLIMLFLAVIFILYQLKKQSLIMKFLHKKCIYLISSLLFLGTFSSLAADYYWVGGSGNYTDINHWANSSGGSVMYTLPPTSIDNVFFDQNSGFTTTSKTVTLNLNSSCHNMIWQGFTTVLPTFDGWKTIEVYGSLEFAAGMLSNGNTFVMKSSQLGETITTNGVATNHITFDGTGGWKFMNQMDMYKITFTRGNLDFNAQIVNAGEFISDGSGVRYLNIAGSQITLSGSNSGANWWYYGTNKNVMTDVETANSFIKFNNVYAGAKLFVVPNDKYNSIEATSITPSLYILEGIYNKIKAFSSSVKIDAVTADSVTLSSDAMAIGMNPLNVNKDLSIKPSSPCGSIVNLGGTINMIGTATVDIKNARMKNSTITGSGAPYTATSSIDAGGNTGWNIPAQTKYTYYWVGGSGDWYDRNHWADNSGGAAGSGCIPGPNDNVIFDNNSGFSTPSNITVSASRQAFCDSMSWKGSLVKPVFSTSQDLEVGGSLFLQEGMSFICDILEMASNRPNESITTNKVYINSDLTFRSTFGAGGWNFQDSLTCHRMFFYAGHLNFNEQYVNSEGFSSPFGGNSSRTLNIANSTIDVLGLWECLGGVLLDAVHTQNSLIRCGGISTLGDTYHNLEVSGSDISSTGFFNKIICKSINMKIHSSLTIDTLIYEKSGIFSFGGNPKINSYLEMESTCGGTTYLKSTSTAERTIIMGNPSQVKVAYAQMDYLSITGPDMPYLANHSIKGAGINAGWNFIPRVPYTFYWVGGSGNWSDRSHWSTTSGLQNGSGCIPTTIDNVIFDNNSFSLPNQIVTMDLPSYCDSMSWIGSPDKTPSLKRIGSNTLSMNGSLLAQRGLTSIATIKFTSSRSGETITSNGAALGSLLFDGTGSWQLKDSLNLSNTYSLIFVNGNLDFNGQYDKFGTFSSANTTNPGRTLNIANSIIDVTRGNWDYNGGIPLTADKTANSQINLTDNFSNYFNVKSGDIYYNIQFLADNGGFSSITNGVFNKIDIKSEGSRISAITTDTLIFASGGTLNEFAGNTTSTIKELWVTNGTPCLPTIIQSRTAGVPTNISVLKTAANVSPDTMLFEFVRIRDLNAVTGTDQAILKKGGQSIDGSGYGLSGNNSNWEMIGYVGPSLFSGLGIDVSKGCTDFPYALQLDAAYKPGSEGAYEWRSNNETGTVLGTNPQLNITTPGAYFLTVSYDAAKTCKLTDTKVVFTNADTLIWTGLAGNSDWNNFSNWKKPDGTSDLTTVPRACTDVLIPAGVNVYPVLDLVHTSRGAYPDAACQNIHFESGAETSYTDSLYYSKAFVELSLQRDRWYMLSSPLQNMYAGDYWLAPWGVTAAHGSAYNRNNSHVYMQQYQIQNPQTGYFPGVANWSKPFNTLDVPMSMGSGYVVGIDQPGPDQTFSFPRPETAYEYFTKGSGLPNGHWTTTDIGGPLDRSKSHRLHLEPGFSGLVPITWDSISRTTIILGNPFMSHLSFSKLQAGNPGVLGSSYYVWTGTSFDAFNPIGDQTAKTDWTSLTIDQIAPMQSFIVEKLVPGNLITHVNINSSMALTAPGIALRSDARAQSNALNIEVYRLGKRESGATLILGEVKNVLTLFSSTVQEPAVVYFGSKDTPYSIFGSELKEPLEVGIRSTAKGTLTLKLQGLENLPEGTSVYLEDRLMKKTQEMNQSSSYSFDNETGNAEGRFFLHTSKATTGIGNTGSSSDINLYAVDDYVHINAFGELIQSIEVFNTQGQLIYKQDKLNNDVYSFPLRGQKQLLIVKVVTGKYQKIQKLQLQ